MPTAWYNWSAGTDCTSATTTCINAGNDLWCTWVADTNDTTASTTVWSVWCGDSTVGSSTGTSNTWYRWAVPENEVAIAVEPRRETDEEREAREQRQREYQAQAAARETERAEARKKADEILRRCLTAAQRAEYEKERRFSLIGQSGERRYRINHGRAGNVEEVNEAGQVLKRICCHPREAVPDEDTMLAQMLHLQHNEEEFLRTANITRVA